MVVEKAIKMAAMLDIPSSGLVENMSYFKCPNCGEEHHIYGESNIEALASKYQVKQIAKLPIDPSIATAVDSGAIEVCKGEWLDELAKAIME
jgi:Mrp family chromosome partitioning ATPase